jgi:hypothetical protein
MFFTLFIVIFIRLQTMGYMDPPCYLPIWKVHSIIPTRSKLSSEVRFTSFLFSLLFFPFCSSLFVSPLSPYHTPLTLSSLTLFSGEFKYQDYITFFGEMPAGTCTWLDRGIGTGEPQTLIYQCIKKEKRKNKEH